MGDLRKDFSRYECACACGCGFAAADTELLDVLQDVRDHFGARTTIGGNRCQAHNESLNKASPELAPIAAPRSYHTRGMAGDIDVVGVAPRAVADYLEAKYPAKYGIGRYRTHTHLDVRRDLARWGRTA